LKVGIKNENMIKIIIIILTYLAGGLLLVFWDMRYRILSLLFNSREFDLKANIESPLYVNERGAARLNGIIRIFFIWPLRIYVSARRIIRKQDIIKKKTNKSEITEVFEKMSKTHFPGGKKQIQDQTNEIIELLNGKINFETAQKMLLKGKGMLSINKNRLYESMKLNFGDILDDNELKLVTAFLMLGSTDEKAIKFIETGFGLTGLGYDEDEIPVAYGEFGRCETNPIPVNGILASDVYLESLKTVDGSKIKFKRAGSIESSVMKMDGLIDIYNIFTEHNKDLGKLYISPYNKRLSRKAPVGFVIEEGVLVNSDDDLQNKVNQAQKYKKEGKLVEAMGIYNQVYDHFIKEACKVARKLENTVQDTETTRTINPEYFSAGEKYLKRDKTVCTILNNMGVIFAELNDKENSKKYFMESIKLTPDGLDYQNPKIGLKNLEK
jgi:hypothetical protein